MTTKLSSVALITTAALALIAGSSAYASSLANPGFEAGPPSIMLPNSAGTWRGDICSRVGAENGIAPVEGGFMCRFDAAFWSCPTGGTGSDLWQLVPVLPSAATARLTARFNRVAGDAQTDTRFIVGLRAHAGAPGGFDDLSPSVPGALADSTTFFDSDANPATWESLSIEIAIPPGTEYVAVLVSAVENVVNDAACPVGEFDGHYVDDVSLTVTSAVPGLPGAGIPLLILLPAAGACGSMLRRAARRDRPRGLPRAGPGDYA